MAKLTIQRPTQKVNRHFLEDLGNGVQLDMVLIQGGSFEMGSPEDEESHQSRESPKHSVMVPTFLIGRYPVTQKQWRTVAQNINQVNIDLKPEPAYFSGEQRPVERVNWHQAVEFCNRLSEKTGRLYRLPSEAEWEYACRARTTTPFHFGETVTDELANYDARQVYGRGLAGKYRSETTSVEEFNAPNNFGLCDMHGNVWEWCEDVWHDNYDGAPVDGSAWVEGGKSNRRILRGGSWIYNPENCRSAYRVDHFPDFDLNHIGFRVVCAVRGTP